ncbi:EAL domain-containing protein [Devosia sp.]|uniref:bifunctional diguanylate cyclase/phosphodiesterase n=1 Tax=Devosia sp. TaxID=1871048 RepID=UPI0037C1AE91
MIAGPAAVTYCLAGKLIGDIRALKVSADAIVAGDVDRPVEVDCKCEVGGLAESFRKMVGRLNSNILRMNVLAYRDSVTGFTNRTVVQHVLTKALEGNAPMPLAVMFIDLDGFKAINDTLGHDAGDELLRQVSLRIVEEGLQRDRNAVDDCTTAYGELCDRPPEEIVFSRFAGDEFIVVLPGVTDEAQILKVCDRIQAALARPFNIGTDIAHVGASIGIARAPLDAQTASNILIDADMAMYAAKERGRGQAVFFDAEIRERLVERQRLELELRTAIEADQFVVHYQPKYDTKTLAVTGYEALVRWQHPRRGLMSPGQFLEIVEKNGQMCELGGLVMKKVVAQLKSWEKAGRKLPVAVNISPSQFRNPLLVERIKLLLETNRIDPSLFEIEITEQAAMGNYAEAAPKLERLREIGVRLAIDDFGMGYSNLTQLVNLPFDVLKIDKSLVDDIGVFPRSEVVIESLIHLAHRMGHTTVAEGIERQDQLDFLKSVGCDSVQGYLLSHPMAPEALSAEARFVQAEPVRNVA